MDFIEIKSVNSTKEVNLLSVDSKSGTSPSNSKDIYVLPVDETIADLMVSLSGKKINVDVKPLSTNVTVKVEYIANLENLKIILIKVLSDLRSNFK